MSTTFAEMIAAAEASGSGPMNPPPAGPHNGVVVSANAKRSGKGKVTIGLLLKVTDGPDKGTAVWSNEYLSPENATALGIWFRTFEALGIPTSWWGQFGDNMDQAAAQAAAAVVGKECKFVVAYREWPAGSGAMEAEVKSIRKPVVGATAPAASIAPLAAAPVAPLAPVAPAPVVASVPQPPVAPF